jgi:hypothetical protein
MVDLVGIFESKLVIDVGTIGWILEVQVRSHKPLMPLGRICRFCQSRQFALVEKEDRHSENAEITQITHCLPPFSVSPWSAAFRRVSYCVNGSLLRPWGNSCAFGDLIADAPVGG